jgi:uncharacterized protein
MTRTDRCRRAIAGFSVVAALALAACATTARERFHSLADPGALPDDASSRAAVPGGYVLQVGPVSVPDVVDRAQWAVRTGTHDLSVLEQHRWAGALGADIGRALAAGLQRRLSLGIALPYEPGQAVTRLPDAVLAVAVTQFETILAPTAVVDDEFDWSVRCRAGATDASGAGRRRIRLPAAGGPSGFDALAAAHARAIDMLSGDIAAEVEAFARRCHGGVGAAR